jgi:hypothetical protein
MKIFTAAAMGLSMSVLALAATPASAQDTALVSVDLSSITADLAAELGVDTGEIPVSIDLPAALAAEICGVDAGSLTDGDSCVATTITDPLIIDLGGDPDDDDDGGEGEGNGGNNSAREFAPGQQDGHARDFAPGQQEGDARDHAPGQVKKDNGGN